MAETGPYGFVKYTYKYDVSFDNLKNSNEVTFKEYSILRESTDSASCEDMYFRMDRNYLQENPCKGGSCKCKSLDSKIVTVNSLFLKTQWQETADSLLSRFSLDAFVEVRRLLLGGPFISAVKAHLVVRAFKDVYNFRQQMQSVHLLNTAFATLRKTLSVAQISRLTTDSVPSTCGLGVYSIYVCPFSIYSNVLYVQSLNNDISKATDYPSVQALLTVSNADISFLNAEVGLPRWLSICWWQGKLDFNVPAGFVTVTASEVAAIYSALIDSFALKAFGPGYSANQRIGTARVVDTITTFLAANWIKPYLGSALTKLAKSEFMHVATPVVCSATGLRCVWQLAYLRSHSGFNFSVSSGLVDSLIDLQTERATNPNSFYKDLNGAPWYNSYLYCTQVYGRTLENDISCSNLQYTLDDALYSRPAGLWAQDKGVSTINFTAAIHSFKQQSAAVRHYYFLFACNISSLLYEVYPNATNFHDNYVVDYFNVYFASNVGQADNAPFNHTFKVGDWEDFGLAQWGGGFITYALERVRTTNQIIRDGMWRYGREDFYSTLVEYSSWALLQGYPNAFIYSISDARVLLGKLASADDDGFEFRRHISSAGTTFIGDGSHFVNGVGDAGDLAFTQEYNRADFRCDDNPANKAACDILAANFTSSSTNCYVVEALYSQCLRQSKFIQDNWIAVGNCLNFETTISSPSNGIKCDDYSIFGVKHPYVKSRGNIVFKMMYSYALKLQLLNGLWCSNSDSCSYEEGGLFVTTTLRKYLFDGYTEPSILKYLNLKHQQNNISFQCKKQPFDSCGLQRYSCSDDGVVMNLPLNQSVLLRYNSLPKDEYFAPYFEIVGETGEMLWPFSSNSSKAVRAQLLHDFEATPVQSNSTNATVTILRVQNPFFALYPAWNTADKPFLKEYQCHFRLFGGLPGRFPSCEDTLFTGRDLVNKSLSLIKFHGNTSIYGLDRPMPVNGSSSNSQFPMSLWNGFSSFPYTYLGSSGGADYVSMKRMYRFVKQHALNLLLSQDPLQFQFQRDITLSIPLPTFGGVAPSKSYSLSVRRFAESAESWNNIRRLGTPRDSNGMPYNIPVGMASLETFVGFPLYVGTPHQYGNKKWGGIEYTLVLGLAPNDYSQRSYVDYDPVTGKALRDVVRQQVEIRVEANALLPALFQSQDRCIPPTRLFAGRSGFGCFTYLPVLWFEDSRSVKFDSFSKLYKHFYNRPGRGRLLGIWGIALGLVLLIWGTMLFISESYKRMKFQQRVYVD